MYQNPLTGNFPGFTIMDIIFMLSIKKYDVHVNLSISLLNILLMIVNPSKIFTLADIRFV